MHIGLIGGIGPAATVVYYNALVAEMRKRGKPLDLTIAQAEASTLVMNNRENNPTRQAEIYADLIKRLDGAGADCVAITSLGGHFCFDETKALSTLPLVSAITPLDAYFVAEGLKRVGLLGTARVMSTKFYGQLHKTDAIVPDGDLDMVSSTYTDIALSSACTDDQRAFFFEEGRKMVEDQGAEAIILAGTDLGLAFHGYNTGYRVIDALDVHVGVLAKLAADELELEEVAA
jgi:aspartate racemase